MAPTPYVGDRAKFAPTLAAAIAMPNKRDGDIITTASREEIGDKGGRPYYYHFAGREAITEDGWRYINGDQESDYFELISSGDKIDLREWGSIPLNDDITDLFQLALNTGPERSTLELPAGSFYIANVVMPNNKVLHVIGPGVMLTAAGGATFMFDAGKDTRRVAPQVLMGFEMNGDDQNVVGITTQGRTNMFLQGVSVRYCGTAGIDLELAYNCSIDTCVVSLNYVGLKTRQTSAGGGGNANLFRNVEIYANTIGGILSGTDSAYPQENNQFYGGTIQNNTLCGLATFETGNLLLNGVHFEANGTSGTTADVDGNTVRKSSCHFHSSGVRMTSCSPSDSNPFVTLESNSVLHLDGMHTYGVTGELVKDYDNTSKVILSGRIAPRGAILAKVIGQADRLDWQSRFAYVTDPMLTPSDFPTNRATSTNQPEPADWIGATREDNVEDPVHGEVTSVTFAASVGSTSSNRLRMPTNIGVFTAGEHLLITLLVKTDADTQLFFDVTDGSYASIAYGFRDREWQKVILLATAGTTNSPGLYIYPLDDTGANVQLAKLQVVKADAGDIEKIHHVLNGNLYNDNAGPVVEQTLTSDETAIALSSNYAKAFELHVTQDAAGGHSIVWPDNAVFYGFPPQPTLTPNSTSIIPFRKSGSQFICTRVDPLTTNYAVHWPRYYYGNIPPITFPDAGTVMIRLKLDDAAFATTTRVMELINITSEDTHYRFADGLGYFAILRSTSRVPSVSLNGAIDLEAYHWLVFRTDAVDDWEVLQVTDDGVSLYSLATATHQTIGAVPAGRLNHATDIPNTKMDRVIFFPSRLSNANITAVCETEAADALPVAPLCRWEMNQDPGTKLLRDTSGNGNHITLVAADQSLFEET